MPSSPTLKKNRLTFSAMRSPEYAVKFEGLQAIVTYAPTLPTLEMLTLPMEILGSALIAREAVLWRSAEPFGGVKLAWATPDPFWNGTPGFSSASLKLKEYLSEILLWLIRYCLKSSATSCLA